MPDRIRIINGEIVAEGKSFMGEILVSNGKIETVSEGRVGSGDGERLINAEGCYVFAGAIDPHVHLQLPTPAGPSSDDFRSGSLAALYGGTTSIIDFVTPPAHGNLKDALRMRKAEASASLTDYRLHMGLSSLDADTFDQMRYCVEKGGIRSFKVYLAYRSTIGIDFKQLEEVMTYARVLNVTLLIHCEDGLAIEELQKFYMSQGKYLPLYHALSRPPHTEVSAVEEVLRLAERTSCRVYLVHISTAGALDAIERAKSRGVQVLCETCPQYLLLDESFYSRSLPDSLAYVLSPPLRTADHRDACCNAVLNGNADVIATDHCPFNIHGQKDTGIHDFTKVPNGGAGIETRLSLLYDRFVKNDRLSMPRFVELVSEAPAKIFDLWPNKGSLLHGTDADIVIWNPAYSGIVDYRTLHQHCDHCTFDGLPLSGRAEWVMLKGRLMIESGQYTSAETRGCWI
jgi:dihydropyrimidinase